MPIFILIIQAVAMSETQSPNVIGVWNVEITFANNEHRAVRFEAELMEKVAWLLRTRDPKYGTDQSLPMRNGIEPIKTR